MEVGEFETFCCHAVDVGGVYFCGTVAADVAVAHVVHEDEDDVWFLGGSVLRY